MAVRPLPERRMIDQLDFIINYSVSIAFKTPIPTPIPLLDGTANIYCLINKSIR